MIIHTRSPEVVVYTLRRFPEINSPEALLRMVNAMMMGSQNYHGLARQVVAHAGNKAGVETKFLREKDAFEARFFVPPSEGARDEINDSTCYIVVLNVVAKVDPNGTETHLFTLQVRHRNPRRDVRVLAAALLAEDEQKCTTTVSYTSATSVDNLTYALQKALARI